MKLRRLLRPRNVLLFLAATVLNFVVAAGLFFGFLTLWGLVVAPWLRLPSSSVVILAAFVLAVAGSGIVYKAAVKLYLRKTGGSGIAPAPETAETDRTS